MTATGGTTVMSAIAVVTTCVCGCGQLVCVRSLQEGRGLVSEGWHWWWTELSDDELRDRLVARGVALPVAQEWVYWRESTFAVEINRILGEK